MLPESELEEVISSEDYSEDIDDSYGEIANIIAGAYTKTFEEMYPKNFRFVRKQQEIITSVKVDVESEKPIPNQNYYQVTAAMKLNDAEMGNLILLIPAKPLGLDEEAPAAPAQEADDAAATATAENAKVVAGSEEANESEQAADGAAAPQEEETTAAPKPVNTKKLDKILELCQERVGEEVGGLMGATLVMSGLSTRLISKEEFFEEPSGKLVFSEMELSGELEGDGCILISIKDAVRLGGTLIMLPDTELEEVISSEDYSEEIDDSYGEIANIIAGAYTKTFEEMYPKSFRFIRKKQEIISPIKVDVESDKPIPNQNYYQVSAAMKLNDAEMGNLILLIPAKPLGFEEVPSTPAQESETVPGSTVSTSGEQAAGVSPAAQTETATATAAPKAFDVKKQKKRVDACFKETNLRMAEEVGALLGTEVTLTEHATRLVNKEDYFFDEASGKQVLAHMDMVGDLEGHGYLYVGLKDAIFIGGTLIMLPPSELEIIISEEDFNDDAEDAYGEIANIISGVYTKVFEELYPDKVRFIKTGLEQVVPMKVDTESDDPMPDVPYYMATSKMTIDGKGLGNIQMLVPATLLQLEQLGQDTAADDASLEDAAQGVGSVAGKEAATDGAQRVGIVEGGGGAANPEFLLVSNDVAQCAKITSLLTERGVAYRILDYKESVFDYLPGDVKAIFLVMSNVDEQGLGVAIKISTASSLPLIAVGPEWTRTKVIKAVKYGVDDILLTPASDDDIAEKVDSVSARMAA
jgi:chemotaxis protein CheY-P-specific phosphatase CheC